MSDIAIRVENLSKRYRIGLKEEMPDTLIGAMTNWFKSPLANFRQLQKLSHFSDNGHDPEDIIWALKDVSFEVKQGEVVGIIGRNGAGKSTLLKILSRITEPTSGRAIINGRVSSLLEVGTGFHPELTGRENVYLNGTVLGMSKQEIDRKFDEIVDFSGVEKFIDTPVKRYSSGMQVRLAFAVAAHLEPEILLVDEVLAVGDISFQRKCLGKMDDVAKSGRTVLFVSHNMSAIQRLCHTAVLLNQGILKAQGAVEDVTERYIQTNANSSLFWKRHFSSANEAYFQKVYLTDKTEQAINHVTLATPLKVIMEFMVKHRYPDLQLSVSLFDSNGDVLFTSSPQDTNLITPTKTGQYRAVLSIPQIFMPKTYGFATILWVPKAGVLDRVEGLQFTVQDAASWSNKLPEGRKGRLAIQCNWSIEHVEKVG